MRAKGVPPAEDHWLLLDAGNSTVKLYCWPEGRTAPYLASVVAAHEWRTSPARERSDVMEWEGLVRGWLSHSAAHCLGLVWSSVVRPVTAMMEDMIDSLVTGQISRVPLFRVDHRAALGYALDYPRPETIGADRLACLSGLLATGLGLEQRYRIAVDLGTAVTVDGLEVGTPFAGGCIAIGLSAAVESLRRTAPDLPPVALPGEEDAKRIAGIGNSTESAIMAGLLWGAAGQVAALVRQRMAVWGCLGREVEVVLTGGDAPRMEPYIRDLLSGLVESPQLVLDRDLLCRGLRSIGRRAVRLGRI